jgi:hypothetical protein
MSSQTRPKFATLYRQVREACGPIHERSDYSGAASDGAASDSAASDSAVELSKSMVELYRQFLVEPSAERFFAALGAFDLPASIKPPSLESLDLALSEGRFDSIRTLARQWSRYFALSVHFHRLAAIAALEMGDADDAELERFAAEACLEGVLKSGDGSAERPYVIAHRADAQEVLAKLKFKPIRQKCVQTDQARCDVFEGKSAQGEQEVWFSAPSTFSLPSPVGNARRKRGKKVAV